MGSAWRLPGYRVDELLGGGTTSEVWRGTVRATGAPVALKKIRMADPAQRAAAVSEAALLIALDHPNLIRLHRLERIEDAVVLVLDYASAGSLAALLGARGRLTPGEVITALSPIAAALAHAHAADVVHGDVTPANVLFTDFGLPLLADLGVARLVGDTKPVHTTLPYADPIVAAGYLPEPASDVYMLGAVTMHAVIGHPPPSGVGELDPDAWQARLAAKLARSDVPGPIAALIGRAMSLDPQVRRTAADFALDLRHAGTPVALELSAGRSRVEPSLARLAAIAAGRPAGGWAGSAAAGAARDGAGAGDAAAGANSAGAGAAGHRTGAGGPRAGDASGHRTGGASGHRTARGWSRGATSDRTGDAISGAARIGRVRWAPPVPDAPPLTAGVRLPSPLATARHRARRRSLVLPAAILVAAAALIAGVVLWWPASSSSRPPAAAPLAARKPATPTSSSSAPASAGASPASGPLDVAATLRVLRGLDATRAQAFADRDPERLARVYRSDELLARDRAALAALVPPGCGLHGVRTTYRNLRIASADRTEISLTVTAVVSPSRLVCGGSPAGRAPAAEPTRLALTLSRGSSGWRVSALHPAAG